VRKDFKGMVERCADCGFDLAGGIVEVVPTAHYMMGGVEFRADCATDLRGLFVAGEDSGGVHGANRLGGNGVANSTVFGAVAGDGMAAFAVQEQLREADRDAVAAAIARCERPFAARAKSEVHALRERLHDLMWDKVGILRDAKGLEGAQSELRALQEALSLSGVGGPRAFNLTWHDWLNLGSLLEVSRAITAAALGREDSRGAHFREDFPQTGPLEGSTYTSVSGDLVIRMKPVAFTRVRPGESLL
jgi:fumarate reductase flavoprotein subunit